MDTELARHVIRAAFRSGRELETLLGLLKGHCTAAEYKTYSRAVATAMDSIHRELTDRVASSHPKLKAEIESSIKKYGRVL